jgi:hypothetical protein
VCRTARSSDGWRCCQDPAGCYTTSALLGRGLCLSGTEKDKCPLPSEAPSTVSLCESVCVCACVCLCNCACVCVCGVCVLCVSDQSNTTLSQHKERPLTRQAAKHARVQQICASFMKAAALLLAPRAPCRQGDRRPHRLHRPASPSLDPRERVFLVLFFAIVQFSVGPCAGSSSLRDSLVRAEPPGTASCWR